jgi:hypothetical protein
LSNQVTVTETKNTAGVSETSNSILVSENANNVTVSDAGVNVTTSVPTHIVSVSVAETQVTVTETSNSVVVNTNTVIADHGTLLGLGDDDHPQYHNDARGDARYYTQDQVDSLIGSVSGAVDSVNGKTGVVVLDADDIDDSTTINKFTTAAELSKLAGIEDGAEVNTVDSVNSQTGVVVLDADDIDDSTTPKNLLQRQI